MTMIPIILLERLQLLLRLAKDPLNHITGHESLAAARELVDMAFHLDAIDRTEYGVYRRMCMDAQISISNAELERARAAIPMVCASFSDVVCAVQN
jgi:hypothetical protein